MPKIRLEHASKRYILEKRPHYAIQDLSLEVSQGEFVFLIGSSGAGKSTLLKLMGGEISPDAGAVYLDEVNLTHYFGPWRSRLARTFGIVTQQPLLVRKRTIRENLLLAAHAGGMHRKAGLAVM